MAPRRVWVRFCLIVVCCLAAPVGLAQEVKFERGMAVVAKSPGLVVKDGAEVVTLESPLEVFRVERVEGDRVRIHINGREGDARASDLVPVDQAEAFFNDQIKANPRQGSRLHDEVRHPRFAGDLLNARLDSERVIQIDPRNCWGFFLRGSIAYQKRDLKNSLVDLNKAIELDQKNARAYAARAECHCDLRNYDKALADVDEVTRWGANKVNMHIVRGNVLMGKGDGDQALREYNEAIRLDRTSVTAHLARANCYGSREDYASALADVNEAIRLDPKESGGYSTRAHIAYAKGDLDGALP